MTLDEAIIRAEAVARGKRFDAEAWELRKCPTTAKDCLLIAKEHEQLAEWLKELRKLKKCRECPLVAEECKLCGVSYLHQDSITKSDTQI